MVTQCKNCFRLIFSLCLLLFQSAKNDALTIDLHNICVNGAQIKYSLYVSTGIQVTYLSTPDYTDFMDCRITLNYAKEWSGLLWRTLNLDPDNQQTPDCERSFVEISAPQHSPYKFCGNLGDMPPYRQKFEFLKVPVTIRFFVNFTTPVIASTTVVNPTGSTSLFNMTSRVKIIFDFTTFFYCTSLDAQSFMCRQSRRCLDKSLRCNKQHNCVSPSFWTDLSDQIQCQDPPPPDLTPIWASLGILAACLVAYWSLYKPGYLLWRLARFRNARCGGRYICSRCCSGGNQGGCFNCCSGSHPQSVSPIIQPETPGLSVKFSKGQQGNIHIIDDTSDFNSQIPSINWMSFKNDDGNHQRELR